MNDTLLNLIELQNLDSTILEKKSRMDSLPKKIKETEKPILDAKSSLLKKQEKLQLVEKKKREKELSIEDINDRIRKLKMKTTEIKSNKEYQALMKEIETAEKGITSIENEILELMQEVEDIKKSFANDEKKLLQEKTNLDNMAREIEKEMKQLNEEIEHLKKERAKIKSKISEDEYNRYMALLKTTRGLAVVEANNEICKGCHLHIPPQLFVEIKNGSNIYNCPQCNRILYFKIELKAGDE